MKCKFQKGLFILPQLNDRIFRRSYTFITSFHSINMSYELCDREERRLWISYTKVWRYFEPCFSTSYSNNDALSVETEVCLSWKSSYDIRRSSNNVRLFNKFSFAFLIADCNFIFYLTAYRINKLYIAKTKFVIKLLKILRNSAQQNILEAYSSWSNIEFFSTWL